MANANYRLHYYLGDTLIQNDAMSLRSYSTGDIIFEANFGTIVVVENKLGPVISRYGVGIRNIEGVYDTNDTDLLLKLKITKADGSTEEFSLSEYATITTLNSRLQTAIPAGENGAEILLTKESGIAQASGVTITTDTVEIDAETDIHDKIPTVGSVRAALEALNNKFSGTLASVLTFKGIVENYDALKEIQDNNTAINNTTAKNGDVYRVTTSGEATIYKTWNNTTGWTDGTKVYFGPNTEFFWHAASGDLVQNPKGFWDILGTDNTDMTGKYDEVAATELSGNTYVIPLLVKDGDSTAITAKKGTANITLKTTVDEAVNNISLTSENTVKEMIKTLEDNINTKLVWSTWPDSNSNQPA